MPRMLFLMPVPVPGFGLEMFASQIPETLKRADVTIDFASPPDGAYLVDSGFESVIADFTVAAAGRSAEALGYDLVCSFTMSDSGIGALRSLLSIPVVGAGESAFHLACQLGRKFSVITMWQPWADLCVKNVAAYGLTSRMASVRHVDTRPDTKELLAGKEDVIFAQLEAEARKAIEQDGADVIVLGSTTMFQSHGWLAEQLPCPVVNPGTATYKMCETLLDLGLAQSKLAFPQPEQVSPTLFQQFGEPTIWHSS